MGLFDTVHTNKNDTRFFCDKCKNLECSFQTKSFDPAMDDYYIEDNSLYSLCEPKKEFWVEYSQKELDDFASKVSNSWFNKLMSFQKGYYREDAYFIENRDKILVNDIHGWINIYTACKQCESWIEFKLKFTDGVLKEVNRVKSNNVY